MAQTIARQLERSGASPLDGVVVIGDVLAIWLALCDLRDPSTVDAACETMVRAVKELISQFPGTSEMRDHIPPLQAVVESVPRP